METVPAFRLTSRSQRDSHLQRTSTMPSVLQLLASGLSLATLVVAQSDTATSPDGLPIVVRPEPGWHASPMRSFSDGVTADGQGRLYALVHERRGDDQTTRRLTIHRSTDRGQTWRRIGRTPLRESVWGAAAGSPDSAVLHVAWAAKVDNDDVHSAVHQRFDTGQDRWLGEPTILQRGRGAEDQFGVSDLGIDAASRVNILVTTHRRPRQPPWPSGWSTGLFIHDPNAADEPWRGPFPINSSNFAVYSNLQLFDGRAHTSYRTSPSHSLIGYRSFRLADRTFDQKQHVEVSVKPASGRYVSNASSMLVDPFGAITVVYPAAAQGRTGKGALMFAHSTDGKVWQNGVLAEDPELVAGNIAHEHFALAQGPGRQAIAIYSKESESNRVLYRRILDGGRPMTTAQVIARSDTPGAYTRVSAQRDPRLDSPVQALVVGAGAAGQLGVRAVLAPRARPVRWR